MADEAFALSPISARPALPSEQDYDAIREAFMETSRGRWFLGEYAKRNRNADTTMVLDAVARIEQAMAAQKQEPARNDTLLEALAAIRSAIEQAEAAASGAFADLKLTDRLAPIHKGARIIKEISWRWREIGADGRICDLIDSQLTAIEASCTEIAETNGSAGLGAAFDLLRQKLDELADGEEAPVRGKAGAKAHAKTDVTAAAEVVVAPAAPPMPEPNAAFEAATVALDKAPAETAFAAPEQPAETPLPEAAIVEPEAEPIEAAAIAGPESKPEAISAQVAGARVLEQVVERDLARDVTCPDDLAQSELAEDEAVLEMVAIEMAAPDDSVDDYLPEGTAEVHNTPPVVAPVATRAPEPPTAPRLEVALQPPLRLDVAPPPSAPQVLPEPAPPVVPEASLGLSLIASGILPRPKPATDPLAPIRRMSQAEKIAFFS